LELVVAVIIVGENSVPTEVDTTHRVVNCQLARCMDDTHNLRLVESRPVDASYPPSSLLLSCSTGNSEIRERPDGSCSEIRSSHPSTSR